MTRKDKLIAMNGTTLIKVADKLGVKVACNKTRTALKEAKANVIERILIAEGEIAGDGTPLAEVGKQIAEQAKVKAEKAKAEKKIENTKDFLQEVSDVLDGKTEALAKAPKSSVKESEEPKTDKTTKAPKKANLKLSELTYKGETKSIKEWAAEINMPWPTLYDRVNRNGWPVDEAIETPLGQRRKKA